MAKDEKSQEQKLRDENRQLREKLDRLLKSADRPVTQIADIFGHVKGLKWAVIQHTEHAEEYPARPMAGNPGVREQGFRRRGEWRVYAQNDSGKETFADRTCPTLREAMEQVFDALGKRLPADLDTALREANL